MVDGIDLESFSTVPLVANVSSTTDATFADMRTALVEKEHHLQQYRMYLGVHFLMSVLEAACRFKIAGSTDYPNIWSLRSAYLPDRMASGLMPMNEMRYNISGTVKVFAHANPSEYSSFGLVPNEQFETIICGNAGDWSIIEEEDVVYVFSGVM